MSASGPPPFQRFLDEHAGAMWRLCVALAGRAEAEDAFQEACLSALRAYPGLRPGSNLRGWALTIAHRKALDVHRGRSRRPVAVGAVDPAGAVEAASPPDDALWAAARELPEGQRAALALRFAGDLPFAEVGAALGISEVAARRRVADGLAALRRTLPPDHRRTA